MRNYKNYYSPHIESHIVQVKFDNTNVDYEKDNPEQ